ncbi:hypothetical protein JOB18_022247 [Solea senegalensis]|uniref:FAM161 centrosomal protein B n=1 Tax=Solea senegalensis TaxID=28829 RepID=A0AAV6S0H8_SOLSE|nr:protein FAM161B [Solea senegalensis]KAG7510469.1 hypothetical protein JOB18_022247 [Solea senegalensis]KAG7510470.1 hypothetical protein JOB18_022247 [Solea senegalensis]
MGNFLLSSNPTINVTMSKMNALLEDGFTSEMMLQQHLNGLKEALVQQLQETEKKHTQELEKKLYQNALLSTDEQLEYSDKKQVNCNTKHVGTRRDIPSSALTSHKDTAHQHRPNSSTKWKHYFMKASTLTPTKAQRCVRAASLKTTQMSMEEEAVAECQKKFCALPVPSHVNQSLFKEMMELRKKKRELGHEERKNLLLSMQKPFSFQRESERNETEREMEKLEMLIATLNQDSPEQGNKIPTIRKRRQKTEDWLESELKDLEDVCSPVRTQTAGRQSKSSAYCNPKLRTAERTRKEKLGFLDERPSFQPKILQQVPDFSRLHKALQTEALRKTPAKDMTKCQPFALRTSALAQRQKKMSPEKSQEPKINYVRRSKSLGTLTSLSTDTLPTYITDAVRMRGLAIRKSIAVRESKNQESANWFSKYQMRSQAIKKSVDLHAKSLDPHVSLKQVFEDKLKHHMMADQQRMQEYKKELHDIKARVGDRPYLFEQVKQRNAKAHAEQTYRNMLRKAGFTEQFVEEKGGASGDASASSRSEEDADENELINENYILGRDENVDDGEKIEDVEEESVKS